MALRATTDLFPDLHSYPAGRRLPLTSVVLFANRGQLLPFMLFPALRMVVIWAIGRPHPEVPSGAVGGRLRSAGRPLPACRSMPHANLTQAVRTFAAATAEASPAAGVGSSFGRPLRSYR